MSVTPEHFLVEARTAVARAANPKIQADEIEMHWRQAVSRGYYAAYHWANSISGRFVNPPSYGQTGQHKELIDRLQYVDRKKVYGGSLANQIAPLLARSREARVKADYYLDQTIYESEVRATIANVESIKTLVAQFLALHTS
ncbi:MAG: hypothetical protein WBQ05_09290 [Candidatus Competibacter denitrificans]